MLYYFECSLYFNLYKTVFFVDNESNLQHHFIVYKNNEISCLLYVLVVIYHYLL